MDTSHITLWTRVSSVCITTLEKKGEKERIIGEREKKRIRAR